jgi:hypothetical protein
MRSLTVDTARLVTLVGELAEGIAIKDDSNTIPTPRATGRRAHWLVPPLVRKNMPYAPVRSLFMPTKVKPDTLSVDPEIRPPLIVRAITSVKVRLFPV